MKQHRREPAYLHLYREGLLKPRAQQAMELLKDCRLCPRTCRVDRLSGEQGFCRTGARASVASFHPHFGEEAPLVGRGGSGTIFFSSCNLLCSFCQNYEISHLREGEEVESQRLAAMMLHLMQRGCENINFVTPSHVAPQILQALCVAAGQGLDIPLIYNSGGYDSADTIKILDGIFDIYMPDFKFWDNAWGERFCRAPDYREQATAAIREMHRQTGDLVMDRAGIAVRGLLVRHLVMPGGLAGTREIMTFLAKEISPDTYVNVMAQYRPCGDAAGDPLIDRRVTHAEYTAAVREAVTAGIKRLDE
ncbi:MAG: radical SAM protein [Pseudomonadota bacterium]